MQGPIGVFDSGYGGLTILKDIVKLLPQYDYIYLGDNARAPYGTRSFDIVYEYTLQAVKYLFSQGCQLVILACNTASAKALRSIQQKNLKDLDPDRRVLGVIRPTAECLGEYTKTGVVGILGTPGTIRSQSYDMEIAKLYPLFKVISHACPMWVPLVEYGEADKPGADYFVKKDVDTLLEQSPDIDTIVLACTHYPHLYKKIRNVVPENIKIISQGEIVAKATLDYLKRHPEMETRCKKGSTLTLLTTEDSSKFDVMAERFLGTNLKATHVDLDKMQ